MATVVESSLVAVQIYNASDSYYYTVCNRPLVDLSTNNITIAGYLNDIASGVSAPFCQDVSTVANTVLITDSSVSSPSSGSLLLFNAANNNTAAVMLLLNGFPAAPVASEAGPLQGGEIISGQNYLVSFDGGGSWIILGAAEGSFATLPAQTGIQAVTLAQLQNGSLNVQLSAVTASTLSSQTLTCSGEIFVPASTNASGVVNYSQLQSGGGTSAATVNWLQFSSDQILPVGQVAYYFTTAESTNLPLHIECAAAQLYQIDVIQVYPSNGSIGLDLNILPNNTAYSGAFAPYNLESCYTNQGQTYAASSSTTAFGTSTSLVATNSFYFDDVNASTQPPYARHIKLYTGSPSTAKLAVHLGGGGNAPATTPGSSPSNGVNMSGCTWDDTTTPYISLGTLSQGPSTNWVVFVKRLF